MHVLEIHYFNRFPIWRKLVNSIWLFGIGAVKEKSTEIIAFADAEMRDAAAGFQTKPCPVLSALAGADPKHADPRKQI